VLPGSETPYRVVASQDSRLTWDGVLRVLLANNQVISFSSAFAFPGGLFGKEGFVVARCGH